MDEAVDFSSWLQAAKQGDAVAMFRVAECYAEGFEIHRNDLLAIRWFQKSARSGVVDAMYELARCYCTGAGVARDLDACRGWLQKAYAADHLMKFSPVRTRSVRKDVLRLLMQFERD